MKRLLLLVFALLSVSAAQAETLYFVDKQGNYLGGFDGAFPAGEAIQIAQPPNDGRDIWDGKQWIPFVDKSPNIPKFFDGLVKSILSGQIPGDVHAKALMVKDLKSPTDQAAALTAFSSDPSYTKEQKILLDALIKESNLALPDVPGKE